MDFIFENIEIVNAKLLQRKSCFANKSKKAYNP
jgi:hypothetical protein